MSMKCKECGKEFDFKNDHIICEDCKTMYFKNKSALQSYLDGIYKSIVHDFGKDATLLRQKRLNDSRSMTIMENKAFDNDWNFNSLKDDMDFFVKSNYNGAQEKEWAEKLYTFNHIADFLIKFYTDKLNSKEDIQ